MIDNRQKLIEKIFAKQDVNGLWAVIPSTHKYFPQYLHYVPNFSATLWTLILLADLKCKPTDARIRKPMKVVKSHLFDDLHGIYTLKENHFPIPCLNGNILYLDGYFNRKPDQNSKRVLEFFAKYQRFDDGKYEKPKNRFCSNTSCYGKHSCYWGVVKLLKGISFILMDARTESTQRLAQRCVDFILRHKVCFSSHNEGRIMIKKIDQLTFPNFYKGDFLEILWILKREGIQSTVLNQALKLLRSKRDKNGQWPLERKMHNMIVSIGPTNQPNQFVTERAKEVYEYYLDLQI